MPKYYSPLRYPGGKNCIFPFVSSLFEENKFHGISYAEPYGGGAGLALRLLFEGYVNKVYINDLDRSIYAFWYSILFETEQFCEWIEAVPVDIEEWKKAKQIQRNAEKVSLFELGKATFFLNRTNVSGVLKGGVIGGISQTGKYKIDSRFNRADLINRIELISLFRDQIIISNNDGISFINKLNRRKENIFIYLDPPYYQKGADLYMNFYCYDDHKRLSEHVKKLDKKWMVSYDNHECILNLYARNSKVMYELAQSASNRVGDEILIFAKGIRHTKSLEWLASCSRI